MEVVFWQNILSPHQAPFIRALANHGHDVMVVTVEEMNADRLALGWRVPDHGTARIVVAPEVVEAQRLIKSRSNEAIHVMAGARWMSLGNFAVRQCLATRRRVGILTEAPDPRGIGGIARWGKYTLERFTRGSRYDFVLAMGEMGVRWFQSCGYPARKVFPFAYVTDSVTATRLSEVPNAFVFLFAGRFVALKGLDVLFHAFSAVTSGAKQLRLLGDGPEKGRLQELAARLGISDQVIWLPKQDSAGVQREMAQADVTVLPSRKDGWGAVVNESLLAGTPVICSTACGAAELIQRPWLGTVFPSGSVEDLTKALQAWVNLGLRSEAERKRIRNWASCLTGESIARYFSAIMQHVYSGAETPEAPWRLPLAVS